MGIKYKFNLIFLSDLGLFLITWEAANQNQLKTIKLKIKYQPIRFAEKVKYRYFRSDTTLSNASARTINAPEIIFPEVIR